MCRHIFKSLFLLISVLLIAASSFSTVSAAETHPLFYQHSGYTEKNNETITSFHEKVSVKTKLKSDTVGYKTVNFIPIDYLKKNCILVTKQLFVCHILPCNLKNMYLKCNFVCSVEDNELLSDENSDIVSDDNSIDTVSEVLSTAMQHDWSKMLLCIFAAAICILILLCIFLLHSLRVSSKHKQDILKQEKELAENRVSLMLSQIQPHFLYNTLTAISVLCEIDPETAQRAVIDFASYLRGNLDSLKNTYPIAFEREMEHVKFYLALESKRFPDKINVEYHLNTTDFMIPALTIETLVENAVRNRISLSENDATLKICTDETKKEIIISVSDDSAAHTGIRAGSARESKEAEIRMQSVTDRLRLQCHGTISERKIVPTGLEITVIIPKESDK